jgi:chromosomal replication initiation ATPase DnaA
MIAMQMDEDVLATASITITEIKAVVCLHFGIHASQLVSPDRHKMVALARHLVAYFAKRATDLSYPEIGRELGGRDHTTIMSSNAKIQAALAEGPISRVEMRARERIRTHVRELEADLLSRFVRIRVSEDI